MIYFDNNATTMMAPRTKQAMIEWMNQGNPSAGYRSAQLARAMMVELRNQVAQICGVEPCCAEERDIPGSSIAAIDPNKYKIIFTSGASESNSMAFRGIIDAFLEIKREIPHVIMSAVEHKSLLDMAINYQNRGKLILTLVKPTPAGNILVRDIITAITPQTRLICVMHANNETGAINNVREIGILAHSRGIVFHCDIVQTFGKINVSLDNMNIDTASISFHKVGGPPGVGVLVAKQAMLLGYRFQPTIFGTQNDGYRGGTENLPGLGGALDALKIFRPPTGVVKEYIIAELTKVFYVRPFVDYDLPRPGILLISGRDSLCNTLLLSVIGARVCNIKIKETLAQKNIIVSVGSACNTASSKASHVLYAIGAPPIVRQGALRISIGPQNTIDEAKKFIREFISVALSQMEL